MRAEPVGLPSYRCYPERSLWVRSTAGSGTWLGGVELTCRAGLSAEPARRCRPSSRYRSVHFVATAKTTEPIGSAFFTIRLRARTTIWPGSRTAGPAMGRKLVRSAWVRWRVTSGPHLFALARAGATAGTGRSAGRAGPRAAV